ncbi:peptidylprolyl isomerase [Neotamlana laminarinivorans]|uniref:Peptidyl-prolyl cis-trans isomerase n=1 Tax=Neotamlana laminarinivorans TaxID=2883124 RepID=A0A9X1L446_9FLAO|nr:peptidylprolyl isomerase [Tamlana laminarinivorans]MCB4798912.1 peptidylprolyl isomerase [Tamlana laminarinivorans]
MRFISLVLVCIIFFNCEDKETKKKTNINASVVLEKQDSIKAKPEANKKLTTKSAMYFFQDYDKKHKENKVRIYTDYGNIDILLFNETKYHRANFIFLTKQNYFDNTQFYRVIDNFIIQGGNSDDTKTQDKRNEIGIYLLPPDTKRGFKHDRGTISMPSSEIEDAYKLASPYEFFIVTQKGGAHFLDGDYTVFGRVINGMDVADKISRVETDEADWPNKNVYIKKVEIIE